MIFLVGAVIAAPGLFTLLAIVVSYIGLTIIIRQEERYLRNRFGADYETYTKRVRRWI
jgi:protein-S-isoprenylcysteine O-methyltransferase Ste14